MSVNDKVIELYNNNNYEILTFLLKNNLITDISKNDDNGNTILHLVVKDNNVDILNSILNWIKHDSSRTSFLNLQNKDGDTALHIAVRNNLHDIAKLLESYGAHRKIENNNGDVITATENDFETVKNDNVEQINSIDQIFQATDNDNIDDMPERLSQFDIPDEYDPLFGTVQNNIQSVSLKGGGKIVGVRYINNDEEIEDDDEIDYDMYGGEKKSKKNIITDAIRKKVLDKIMKEQKMDEIDALAVRAALWKKVKEEYSELSNIEKHKMMEELATKEIIKKLDKKVIKEIKTHIKKKKEQREKELKQ